MSITPEDHAELSKLLEPQHSYLLTPRQYLALRVLLRETVPVARVEVQKLTIDEQVAETWRTGEWERNTDCDCGNTDDPNHPRKGFCKRKLGGVSV